MIGVERASAAQAWELAGCETPLETRAASGRDAT
jgi:hypothetical protein